MALNFELVVSDQLFLSSFSHLQLIQKSAPSTFVWRQCDILMGEDKTELQNLTGTQLELAQPSLINN